MRDQLIEYVKLLFAGTPDSEDMRQEILQNTLDRYDDLVSQGKSPEAAYRLAIAGIGDISELLGAPEESSATVEENTDYRGRPLPSKKKKLLQAISIAMYICCVIPVIVLATIGFEILGVCLMFFIIAVATVLLILSSDDIKSEQKQTKSKKSKGSIVGIIGLIVYFVLSFSTNAWHITWLVFPITGAVQGLVTAIKDLKGEKNYEA